MIFALRVLRYYDSIALKESSKTRGLLPRHRSGGRGKMAIVRNASILFVCTMAGNMANYCFQFIMGRRLSIEDFGTMNALLSVSTSITLPTGAIMIVIAKYASTYRVMADPAGISSLYAMALKKVTAAPSS
jgi:O-antigen/teichoic acid export membrane protein